MGISPAAESQVRLVNSFRTECYVTKAYHLWGVKVRVLEGGELPVGRIRVLLDHQDLILKENLVRLAEDRDPLLLPWESRAGCQFWATEVWENEADGDQRLGYMLPNGSYVEIWLDLEPLDHPVKLEFEILMNLYDGGKRELKGVKKTS
jgi:hypothetical protein